MKFGHDNLFGRFVGLTEPDTSGGEDSDEERICSKMDNVDDSDVNSSELDSHSTVLWDEKMGKVL